MKGFCNRKPPFRQRKTEGAHTHTKRCNKLSIELCERAVRTCFDGKWRRNDVLSFVEKYAGIPRDEIKLEELTGERTARNEAVRSCALALFETLTEIIEGGEPDSVEPVIVRPRPDGITGKIRDIALLSIMHQLIGHAAKLMLDPLFKAKILPTQHASLPGHGQTCLKNQTHGYFLKESLGIKYVVKTDVVHAYESTTYEVVIGFIKRDLPKARDLHAILAYLGKIAPGGHLIIGGYIDAWLFNYLMSYAIRFVYEQSSVRRGKKIRHVVRCVTFMDDFGYLSKSAKGLKRSTRNLDKWMQRELNLRLKWTSGIIKLLSIEEETRRRAIPRGKARRGCPVLDMAGFRICRTHIMIRPRVFLRVRRQFLRSWDELQKTGTLRRVRAKKLISYNSHVSQSDSIYIIEKYHIKELMEVAECVSSFHQREDMRKRREELYDLQRRRSKGEATEGFDRAFTGEDGSAVDGQRENVHVGRRGTAGDGQV